MQMKKGDKYFVRVDEKVEDKVCRNQDLQDHMDYVTAVAKERYFIGGGFSNVNGGMVVFAAKNLAEAEEIAKKDPLIERGLYRYQLFAWKLLVLSEDM